MFHKDIKFYFILSLIFLTASAPVFLPSLEEGYFSESEQLIVDETLRLIGFDFGYDWSLRLHYLTYTKLYSKSNFAAYKRGFSVILRNRDMGLLKSIYYKLYRLSLMTHYEMNELKSSQVEKFKQLQENYFKPLKIYLGLLENYIYSRDASARLALKDKKRSIEKSSKQTHSEEKKSIIPFFTFKEITILKETTAALDFDFGYDTEIELPYIFSFSYSSKNRSQKEKAFSGIVKKMDSDIVMGLYEKMYKMYAMTKFKMQSFKLKADWKYYTFIKNELYPPLKIYFDLLGKNVNLNDKSFREKRKQIDKWVEWYYNDKDKVTDTF